MKYNFITTFNKRLYDEYAHEFISTYLNTNQIAPLTCYIEEDNTDEIYPQHENISYKNVLTCQPECQKFVDRNKDRPVKVYTENALMWNYKVFGQYDMSLERRKTFYIDADCIFYKQFTEEWLDDFLPDDVFFAGYTRELYYTETGFIGFNNTLDISKRFFEEYVDLFKTDDIYKIKSGQLDCTAIDTLRRKYKFFPEYKEKPWGQEYANHGHVMAVCPKLSPYLDHRKGGRKAMDTSPEWRG